MLNNVNLFTHNPTFKAIAISKNSLKEENPFLYRKLNKSEHYFSEELGLFSVKSCNVKDIDKNITFDAFLLKSLHETKMFKIPIEKGLQAGLKAQGVNCHYLDDDTYTVKATREAT